MPDRADHPDFIARSVIGGALLRHGPALCDIAKYRPGYGTKAEAIADEILKELRRFCTVGPKLDEATTEACVESCMAECEGDPMFCREDCEMTCGEEHTDAKSTI
jgi:hypothetical protein